MMNNHCTALAQIQWYCRAIVCEEIAQDPYLKSGRGFDSAAVKFM